MLIHSRVSWALSQMKPVYQISSEQLRSLAINPSAARLPDSLNDLLTEAIHEYQAVIQSLSISKNFSSPTDCETIAKPTSYTITNESYCSATVEPV